MAGNSGSSNAQRGPRTRSKRIAGKNAVKKTGKSRRRIFKMRPPMKAPVAVSTPVTSDTLYYKGSYFTVGDVVSVVDFQHRVYYAQIRGLLQDQYCEKSAVLTWLLPTRFSPRDRFDPATYILGPEEDIPRKLECLEFVCHAPSDYYQAKNSPYPTLPIKPESGYIWTRLGQYKIVQLPYNGEEKKKRKAKEAAAASAAAAAAAAAAASAAAAAKPKPLKNLLCLANAAAELCKEEKEKASTQ